MCTDNIFYKQVGTPMGKHKENVFFFSSTGHTGYVKR